MRQAGIYFTDTAIDVTCACRAKDGEVSFRHLSLERSPDKEAQLISSLRGFFLKDDTEGAVALCAVSRTLVFNRILSFPSSDPAEIKKMAGYELKNIFPLEPEELVYDTNIISIDQQGYSKVMLYALSKARADDDIELLKKAGLIVSQYTVSTGLLAEAYAARYSEPVLWAHCEHETLECAVLSQGQCLFSRGAPLARAHYAVSLQKEIRATFTALEVRDRAVSRVILSGKAADIPGIAPALQETAGCPVILEKEVVLSGLCARHDPARPFAVNLLPLHHARYKMKTERRKTLVITIALLILNLVLASNIVSLKIKQKQAYLSALNKEMATIEQTASRLQKKNLQLQAFNSSLLSSRYIMGILASLYSNAPEGMKFDSLVLSGEPGSGAAVISGQAVLTDHVLAFSATMKSSPLFTAVSVDAVRKHGETPGSVVDFQLKAEF